MSNGLKKVRRIYDHDPEGYDRAMSGGITNRILGARRRKVGEIVRGKVLDVGFGTGISLAYYPTDAEVVGIDASPAMLEVARRAMTAGRPRAEMLVMDAEQLAFPDHTFDSVAFNLCLCTIPDPLRAVREGVRVARPGAPMVFLEHVRSHVLPVALVQEALNPILVAWQADHLNRRTVDLVKRAGVEVVSVERWLLGIFNLIVGRAPAA
jgi:ubiquinone/menaquinone biosynthesis C-methylase UbiE